MVVGTSLCFLSLSLLNKGNACAVKRENVIAGCLMYGSYLYLFAEFAVKRFILSPPPRKREQKKVL
jgi:hypothetical protein